MIRHSRIISLIVIGCFCMGWAITRTNARAEDADKNTGDKMMMHKEAMMKFKEAMTDDMMMKVKSDVTGGGADVADAHMMAMRQAAEKELMKDPDIKAKVEALAKDPDVMKMHADDMSNMKAMMNDQKMMRQMMMEMVVRESCKEAMMSDSKTSETSKDAAK